MSIFVERLKEYMQDLNLTQKLIEDNHNIHHTLISDYLSDKTLPSYITFIKLLYLFNCSADYLLGLDEIPTEETLYPVLPFHERLRQVLREKKISGEKLKRDMNVSGSVYYNWTSGKALPTSVSLIRLAEYLDCSIDYLIGRRR